MPAGEGTEDPSSTDLAVRPPRQRRSREAWSRVLDAGVALVEEGGYEAFTIAAVCDRARIAPRAIYARVDTKDALFLAVYEHGLARVRADHAALVELAGREDLAAEQLAVAAVETLARLFDRHRRLLRSVVLLSSAHPEVTRRGAAYSRELGELFAAVLMRRRDEMTAPDPEAAVSAAFGMVFASLVFRVAYGTDFVAAPGRGPDDGEFVALMTAMVTRFLLAPATQNTQKG